MSERTDKFIALYAPLAVGDALISKIPPSIKIAQAALETGWGKSGLNKEANNYFGIKAGSSWTGKVYNAATHEYYDGINRTDITSDFRAYGSPEESFADHSRLLTGLSRYRKLFDLDFMDYKGWARGLKEAGYATSPTYPEKLISIIEKYNLSQYDVEAKKKSDNISNNDNFNGIDIDILSTKIAEKIIQIIKGKFNN